MNHFTGSFFNYHSHISNQRNCAWLSVLVDSLIVNFCMSRYNTFCGISPEVVKKMAKKELAEEVWLNILCGLSQVFLLNSHAFSTSVSVI
jgi:hypothetical protein